jgi:AraC-like DNA-binding protein
MLQKAGALFGFNKTPHFKIQNTRIPFVYNKFLIFARSIQSNALNLAIESNYIHFLASLFKFSFEGQFKQDTISTNQVFLLRARDYLHEHFLEDISLDQLIQVCPMSKAHFIRSFKLFFGIPPHSYLRQIRINNLKMEIEQSGKPENTHCFTDQSHFIKSFKQFWGITPGHYAKIF